MARASILFAAVVLCASLAHAQVDSASPHRIALAGQVHVLGDAGARAAFLDRTIAVDFDDVPLRTALATIAREAGLRFTYDEALVSRESHLSLHATSITVIDALSVALRGTAVDAYVWPNGDVTLRESGHAAVRAPLALQGTAIITGHVTDGALKTPLASVSLRIEGTTLGTTADADGKYTLSGIAPGTCRVTARRVGYQPLSKDITLNGDQTATLDFALAAAPTRLDEVVTTAVGQQRRYEVGNDISTINADSIAPTAPITSLTDLISARAPGVTVLETSGLTGSGEAIRIEGLTSLVLQSDPILIVDGVRQDNSAGGDIGAFSLGTTAGHPTPSRLNDLDFSDIATIDILKGPAASTEYGTDAANGVIVVTTKHGTVGRPQWRASAEQTASDIPESFPNGYYSWGHTTDGKLSAVDCPVVALPGSYSSSNGNCTVDSVTQWNPLNHSAFSIFGTGERQKYDLSVSGGSDVARYYVSGGLANERGVVQMPAAFEGLAANLGISVPGTVASANTEDQRSLRATMAIRLGPTADFSASAAYLSTYQRTPETQDLLLGLIFGPAIRDSADFYGYGAFGGFANPLAALGDIGTQQTDRFTGGLNATWRPTGWLTGHAAIGLDHGSQALTDLAFPELENGNAFFPTLGQGAVTTDLYSVDLRATATNSLSAAIRASTSIGLQMADNRLAGQTATVFNITSTNETLNGYANPEVHQVGNRSATLGGYGEEQLSLADRLFLTGAVRVDAASGFGRNYATATYPKASVSWLALDGSATTVRVRGAFGAAGVQPDNGANLQLYQSVAIAAGGQVASGDQLNWPGNPGLRPERTQEFEGGADIGFWQNRVTLEVTGYAKMTQDALVMVNLGTDLGNYQYQENIGSVRNSGAEASLIATLVNQRAVSWDVTFNGAFNRNRLISLAPGVGTQIAAYPVGAQIRQAVGYPLYGLWARHISYADLNNDGIIEASDITRADSTSFLDSSEPTREVSVATRLGLWHGLLTLNALIDYRGGYSVLNTALLFEDELGLNQREGNDPTAPLAAQARYVSAQEITNTVSGTETGSSFIQDGSFVRFRELGVTLSAPMGVARRARLSSLSLTGAVRNLALWTRYPGVDPEVSNTGQQNTVSNPTSGGLTVNNDIRFDQGSVPLPRYWVLRLTAGL